MPLIQERLEKIQTLSLKAGAHSPNSTFCILEAVAFVAGEPWSDHPECACPIIGAFLRSWNDSLPTDADRDRLLKPLIRDLVGSKSTKEVEQKRALLCADWLIRVNIPTWMRLAGLTVQADALEALPEITAFAQIPSIHRTIAAAARRAYKVRATARDPAGAAAWPAVGAAGREAAWKAAGAAAWYPPWDTVGENAQTADWAAAWDAVWDSAGAAAGAATEAQLQPTVLQLQDSALLLVKRMLTVRS